MINLHRRVLNKYLLPTLFLLMLTACKETIDARQLENINGLYYKLNEHEPFTGIVINNSKLGEYTSYHVSNCTIEFKKGEMDGAFVCYSLKDGIKVTDMRYKHNIKDGTQLGWNKDNGLLKWKIEWKNGKRHGIEEQYNSSNRKLIEEIHWENGQKVGTERKWNMNGDILLEDFLWVNGKETGYSIYNNVEFNYKDGLLDGINRRFELIGSKSDYDNLYAEVTKRQAGRSSYIELPHYVSLEETYQQGKLISSVTKYKDKEQELEFKRIEKEREEEREAKRREQEMNEAHTLE